MIIKAVRLYENGFMTQPFAFGGEGAEGRNRSHSQVSFQPAKLPYRHRQRGYPC